MQNFKVSAVSSLGILAVFSAMLAFLAVPIVSATSQSGTTLTADKTAEGHWLREYEWSIDKSVTPDTWDLFNGDSGESEYTIAVEKGEPIDTYKVTGEVCVTNGGAYPTENLTIIDEVQYKVGAGQFQTLLTFPVDLSSNPVLDPAESDCYTYEIEFEPDPEAIYRNVAHVTIDNHAGWLPGGQNCPGPDPCPFGPDPKTDISFPESPEIVNDSITVDDTNGESFEFSDSGSVSYNRTFYCDNDEGTHDNVATIVETGQSDDASVTVNCYELEVSKTAETSFDRTYLWDIEKTADESSLLLSEGQSYLLGYNVTVDLTGYEDSNWAAEGTISVHNPAPVDATINSVTDMLDGMNVTVECGVTFPYELAAGDTLNCTYSTSLPDGDSLLNTAYAEQQNYDYDKDLIATPDGTTEYSANADVDFSEATINEIDTCIDVDDDHYGFLGTVCKDDQLPVTFEYDVEVGPYEECGLYEVDNTASFVTNDTQATGSSTVRVPIEIPCENGCTLTIGYWKNHAGFGPQDDVLSQYLPITLGDGGGKSINVTTAEQAVELLKMNGEASNGINKLYAQLLATKLNIANGADDSAISDAIAEADTFLALYDNSDWDTLSKAERKDVLQLMKMFDEYNNGGTGPGHCSE